MQEELITEDYDGFVYFDDFSANCSFAWNFDRKAQYCWARLIPDIRFLLKHLDNKTTATSGKQSRSFFDFLNQASEAKLQAIKPPSRLKP